MISMDHFKIYCEIAVSPSVVQRAVKVALIVGTALNFINQGEVLMTLSFETLSLTKLLLTYAVPYSVTTYTATAMKIEFQIGTKAPLATKLECRGCGNILEISQNELIPECDKCGIQTKWKLK